ncbi:MULTISPECIES: ABC transporter permease [Oceanobacillus]|uniref:ABC transporter permease n=1 Tax=Oceanobacillus aidingensis TaxID=645964 RepID=A0ABV9K3W3_9BACI|nr:ABC transporter permease [Oceanobacillus oncorhynchi]MDM8099593.1 ABC transporter permease [Oceanobacillus oncorhynchi]UUI41954.1 ABC transporter permease [Oceanobacillus oncorhynchi]
MKGILLARIREFIRNPFTFLLFTGMSIVFAWVISSLNVGEGGGGIPVPVYVEDGASDYQQSLEEQEAFRFYEVDKEALQEELREGDADTGVILSVDRFDILVGVESPNAGLIQQTVQEVYTTDMQEALIREAADAEGMEADQVVSSYQEAASEGTFDLSVHSFSGEESWQYDDNVHRVGGFALFFAIYTIAYGVVKILTEKRMGVWDRMILSPIKKSEMYIANLFYSFIEGYLQIIIIFSFFYFWRGITFNDRMIEILLMLIPYALAIVAMSILITALVKNVEQFNAAISIITVSLAMIGGAFWPLEIVSNPVLLFLANLNPIKYGLDIIQGAAVYGYSFTELLQPISILTLMTVLFTGLGIHLMERRHI